MDNKIYKRVCLKHGHSLAGITVDKFSEIICTQCGHVLGSPAAFKKGGGKFMAKKTKKEKKKLKKSKKK